LALYSDTFPNEPYADEPRKKKIIFANKSRSFNHEVRESRAGATVTTPNAPTTTLTDDQLKQCGNAYINNGIVRGVVDRSQFFIQGDRTKAVVEANDELLEVSNDEEQKELEQQITDDTLTVGGIETETENADGSITTTTEGGQPARIKELKRKIVRVNKRVKLYTAIEKAITSALVFGRGFVEIVRNPAGGDYPQYGEPIALKHLVSRSVVQVFFNDRTGAFEGIDYNTGKTLNPVKFIPAIDLIPFFHDDNNIMENQQGSGLSAVWPILSVSQSDDVINDEDIPEITKNTGGVLNLIYAGTNNDDKIEELTNKLDGKTQVVHGLDGVEIQSVSLGRDPHELTDVRVANGKYICQCMNLPLFLLYEDTANFATANQTMQVYKSGVLKRYRVWLQGILEDYWYDPILADHLNIDIKDVISMPIKIKAIFEDINFETRREVIEADEKLVAMDVMDKIDVAKDIDRKDLAAKLESQEAEEAQQRDQAVDNAFMNLRSQNLQLQQQNQGLQQFQQQQRNELQQVSAAASIKAREEEEQAEKERLQKEKDAEEEKQIRLKRIELLEKINNKVKDIQPLEEKTDGQ
jgi:hypothetical protein